MEYIDFSVWTNWSEEEKEVYIKQVIHWLDNNQENIPCYLLKMYKVAKCTLKYYKSDFFYHDVQKIIFGKRKVPFLWAIGESFTMMVPLVGLARTKESIIWDIETYNEINVQWFYINPNLNRFVIIKKMDRNVAERIIHLTSKIRMEYYHNKDSILKEVKEELDKYKQAYFPRFYKENIRKHFGDEYNIIDTKGNLSILTM